MKLKIIIIIAILLGIGLLAYPLVSNYLAEHDGAQAYSSLRHSLTSKQTRISRHSANWLRNTTPA